MANSLAQYLADLQVQIKETESRLVFGVVISTSPLRVKYGEITLEDNFLFVEDGVTLTVGQKVPLLKTNRSQLFIVMLSKESASQEITPQEILSKIKTVDGSGSGLDADLLDGKHASDFSLVGHTQDWATITGKPTTATRWPSWTEVTSKPTSFPPEPHNHVWSTITSKPDTATRWPTWEEVTGKPTTFAPSAHNQAWSTITGKPSYATRWPTWTEVTSKPSTFPPNSHTHTLTDVTDLSSIMNIRSNGLGLAIGKASGKDAFEVAWPTEFLSTVMIGGHEMSTILPMIVPKRIDITLTNGASGVDDPHIVKMGSMVVFKGLIVAGITGQSHVVTILPAELRGSLAENTVAFDIDNRTTHRVLIGTNGYVTIYNVTANARYKILPFGLGV